MPVGPGKYDALCTHVREAAKADGVIVIVINGEQGSGFSCQANFETTARLPELLEIMARQIRDELDIPKL